MCNVTIRVLPAHSAVYCVPLMTCRRVHGSVMHRRIVNWGDWWGDASSSDMLIAALLQRFAVARLNPLSSAVMAHVHVWKSNSAWTCAFSRVDKDRIGVTHWGDMTAHPPDDAPVADVTAVAPSRQQRPRVRRDGEGTLYEYVRKLPSGSTVTVWRAKRRVEIRGKKVRVAGQGKSAQAAMESLEKNILKKRVAVGEVEPDEWMLSKDEAVRTVERCLHDWLAAKDLTFNSRRGYEAKIRIYLIPAFGHKPIRLLTTDELETFFNQTLPNIKKADGTPYLKSTARRQVYFIMHGALEYALKRRHITFNPLAPLPAPKRDQRTPKQARALRQASHFAPQLLLKHLKGSEDEARWMLALLGLRQSEVLGLTDDCVKRRRTKAEPGKLRIQQMLQHESAEHGCGSYNSKTRKWDCGHQAQNCPDVIGVGKFVFKDSSKTESGVREIPLVEPFYSIVMSHLNRQRAFRITNEFSPLDGDERFQTLLFTTKHGMPRRHQDDRKLWKDLLKEAKVPMELRVHDNRHLAATVLFSIGVQPEQIMMIMGWSAKNYHEMMKNYAHPSSAVLQGAMSEYGKMLFKDRD